MDVCVVAWCVLSALEGWFIGAPFGKSVVDADTAFGGYCRPLAIMDVEELKIGMEKAEVFNQEKLVPRYGVERISRRQ